MTPLTYIKRLVQVLLVMISVEPILVVSQLSFTCNSATDPGSCLCTEKVIYCQSRNPLLESVPLNLRTKAETINLSNNEIKRIQENDFRNVDKTENIILSHNEISSIHKNAFLSLTSLRKLLLDGNNLMSFTSDTLNIRNLFSLQTLNLSRNPIGHIDARSLLNIANFQVVTVIDSQSFLCTCPLLQIRSELMAMFSRLAVETALSDIYCNKGTDMSSLFTLRMEDAKFLQCIGTPTVYAPAMSCPWCNGVNSLVWCKMNITCVGEAAFCESTYLFNNAGNFISSHCQKRTVCLDEERNNRKSCIFNGTTQIRCTYCSYGEVDEPIIDGGLFTEHHFFLSFIKERAHSEEYSDNDRIASSIRRTLHNFYGGIVVRVQDYFPVAVDDKVRVSAIIYVTVLNIQNVKELKEKIAKDFLDKVHEDAGYFKDQNVDPSSIFLADSDKPHCPKEVTKHLNVEMVWEDSYVGESTHLNISADGWLKTFSRKCIQENLVPKWSSLTIKITNGTTDTTLPTMEPLGITTFPPATAASMLINASLLAHDLHQSRHMSNEDYERTIEQLEDLCQDESLAVPGVSRAMVFCLNELLVHHKEHLSAEGGFNKQRLLDVIEKVAERTPLTNGSFKYVEKLLAVSGFRLPSDTTGELVMSISGFLSTGDLTAGNLDIEIKKNISTESTSINIPLTSVSASVKEGRIVFIVHATEELFVTQNYSDQYIVKPILSAIISGAQVNLVDERILITLLHADKGTHQPSCVYWNRSDSGELGQWSTEGCELVSSSENKTICACNHLTNFGLLMDIYEVKASISEAHLERLSIITIAGSMISFCCLLLTIFNYTIFSNLRKNTPSKIVYNLCWALMLFNGFFLLGHFTTDVIEDNSSCKAMAALLHYSLLAAMFWMSVNAFFMYISVVKVFNIQIAYFFLKCFLFAWGLPAIFVGITLLLNESKNYGKINTEFCWIKKPAFYVTLVSPISVSLALNVYVFCLTMREVSKSNRRHSSLMIGEDRNFRVNLRAAFSLLILLGLTWIFAFFTFGQLGTLFSYLFSIFNSLQGMFIFTFYCLLKRDVLNAWMVLFGYKTNEIIFSSAFSESSRSSLRKHSKGDDYRFSESLEKEVPADIQEDGTAIN